MRPMLPLTTTALPLTRAAGVEPALRQTTYSLPQRHAHVYAVHLHSPPGLPSSSKVLVYAHDTGVTILWRSPPPDRKPPPSAAALGNNSNSNGDFSAAYTVRLGCGVYALSSPSPSSAVPGVSGDQFVLVAACADNTLRVLSIPATYTRGLEILPALTLHGATSPARAVAAFTLPSAHARESELLVAAADGTHLLLHHIALHPRPRTLGPVSRYALPASSASTSAFASSSSAVSFSPSGDFVLLAVGAAVKILDVASGRWVLGLHAPFLPSPAQREAQAQREVEARRRRVLAAEWCFAGRGVVGVLEGGVWGVWDLMGVLGRGGGLEFVPAPPLQQQQLAHTAPDGGEWGGVSVRPVQEPARGVGTGEDETVAVVYGRRLVLVGSLMGAWGVGRNGGAGGGGGGGANAKRSAREDAVAVCTVHDRGAGVAGVSLAPDGTVAVGLGVRVGVLVPAAAAAEKTRR